jgi:hypothetical protein
MSRDLTKPIVLTLGDETLMLRLDMTAMLDFEVEVGMTVAEFLQPFVPVLEDLQDRAEENVTDANATGLRMIEDLLAVPNLSAKNVLALAWALAGGEDLDETLREFGRRVNIGTGRALVEGVVQAVSVGMPERDEDEGEDTDAQEDPTPRPE